MCLDRPRNEVPILPLGIATGLILTLLVMNHKSKFIVLLIFCIISIVFLCLFIYSIVALIKSIKNFRKSDE